MALAAQAAASGARLDAIGERRLPAVALPVAALDALAAIDLATGADAHFSRTALDHPGDLPRVLGRRYELAWNSLLEGIMPFATIAALGLAAWGVRRRAALAHLPVWRAAIAGGLAGAMAGALVNDSGPMLFVLAVAALAAATVYARTGGSRTEAVQTGQ